MFLREQIKNIIIIIIIIKKKALGGLQIPRWLGSDPLSAWWLGLAPATLEFWVRFPNERNQGKQAHPVLKDRVPHGSQPRPGWALDPPMVGIRSPVSLVVGSCTSHPGVLGSIPKRKEPGKTGAPCVKVPGSSRVPAPPWVGSRSPDGWDQIPCQPGGWILHQPPWSFGFDSQTRGTRENRRTCRSLCEFSGEDSVYS
jgi:hypothetical protein